MRGGDEGRGALYDAFADDYERHADPMTDWLRLDGSYFDVDKVQEVWKGWWHVAYWRQPLTATCEEFRRAGFVIERLVEPRPSDAIRERDPEEFAELAQRPAFIAFRLVKHQSDLA